MPKKIVSDPNKPENSPAETHMPDSKDKPTETKSSAVESHIKASKAETNKNHSANKIEKQPAIKAQVTKDKPAQSNKLAGTAIAIACLSILASGGHYMWQQQQSSKQATTIAQENTDAIKASQKQTQQMLGLSFSKQLNQQQQAFSKSLQQLNQNVNSASQKQIAQLTQQLNQLEQRLTMRQPSDWLIHEAEYLVRVAARTMWLEQDTKAAIGLLTEADQRLSELNSPKYLPVRALIHEDIQQLEKMPTLQSETAILSLMALNKQIKTLPLAGVDLGESLSQTQNFELSDDIGDWQQNLSKTWQKFLKDFITVRRRTGMVEPLMAPEQQQHLKQNLSLKIQLALWAVHEQKADIYQQTLSDIQTWINEFFDMQSLESQQFVEALQQLKKHTIHFDYPSDLASLSAMKKLLNTTITRTNQSPENKKNNEGSASKTAAELTVEKKPKPLTTTPNASNKPVDEEVL